MSSTNDREQYLQSIHIGERAPHNDRIRLDAYDPTWPSMFETIAATIRLALGAKVKLLEHTGSTSVPGLSAKPIIDVILEVEDSSNEPDYVSAMEHAGFVLRIREPDWFQHRMFRFESPSANVHVFSAGCEETARMLAFRNWLRRNVADRELYQRTKQALANRVWEHVQNYADAKSEVVSAIMARALAADKSYESRS